jgi:subtilisin family serine protease
MERSSGNPGVQIGVIDGPVFVQHPELSQGRVRQISSNNGAACAQAASMACLHGTFVTGILAAERTSRAPAICPNCTILVRPVFREHYAEREQLPSAAPTELAAALTDCINAGARVINLSLALAPSSASSEADLREALDRAASRAVLVVAAAGNQASHGSSIITRHPWVIPVVACDFAGAPMGDSNLSGSTGRHGLRAPGDGIESLGAQGDIVTLRGTSVAVPFVTGAIALLWSAFPDATAAQIRIALTHQVTSRRPSVVPPLLDASAAYQTLLRPRAKGWIE